MPRCRAHLFGLLIFLTAGAVSAQNASVLKAYESCAFPDGLQVSDVTPMPSDIHSRPVQTRQGARSIPLLAGRRITFSYPAGAAYASVKAEALPAADYAVNRKELLEDFDDIAKSDPGVTRNTQRKPTMSGFSVTGLDRNTVSGSTLGVYLLLDDANHVAATVYLLNPPDLKLKSMTEYASKRDTFLYNYTRCIRNNQTSTLFGVGK